MQIVQIIIFFICIMHIHYHNIFAIYTKVQLWQNNYLPQFVIKNPLENFVISIILRTFIDDNQTVTNNTKRPPNDFKGQGYRNFQYY